MKNVHFELRSDDDMTTAILTVPCTIQAAGLSRVFGDGIPAEMRTHDPEVAAYPGRMDVYFLKIGPSPRLVGRSVWRTESRLPTPSDLDELDREAKRFHGKKVLQALGLLPGWSRTSRVMVAAALAALWGADRREVDDMLETEVLHRIRPLLDRETLERVAAAELRFRYVGPPELPTRH